MKLRLKTGKGWQGGWNRDYLQTFGEVAATHNTVPRVMRLLRQVCEGKNDDYRWTFINQQGVK